MKRTRQRLWVGLLSLGLLAAACQPASMTPAPSASAPPPSLMPSPTPMASDTPEPTPGEPPTPTPPLPTAVASPIEHLTVGQPVVIEWIEMVTRTEGWALGGLPEATRHLLRTSDGGMTWKDATPPDSDGMEAGMVRGALAAVRGPQQAWIVYSGVMDLERGPIGVVVWRTTDGGGSWLPSSVIEAPGGSGWFEPIALGVLEDGFGWLMAAIDAGMMKQYIALYTTSDGGASWVRVLDPFADQPVQSCPKTGLAFADASSGWMTRDCAGLMDVVTVIVTDDGGVTWTEQALPPVPGLPGGYTYPNLCTPGGIQLESPLEGSLVVACRQFLETPAADGESIGDGLSARFSTVDGGQTWSVTPVPEGSLFWLDAERGWALGRTLHWTEDGGSTWEQVHAVNWDGQFTFVDEQYGWAVATSDDETALVQTTTGGRKWTILKPVIGP